MRQSARITHPGSECNSPIRKRRRPTLALAAIVGLLSATIGASTGPRLLQAVIVDQLSLTHPNAAFRIRATSLLTSRGYQVTYVDGLSVTVEFFRTLPLLNPAVLILRMHTAREMDSTGHHSDNVVLFTGETIDPSRFGLKGIPSPAMTAVAQSRANPQTGEPKTTLSQSDLAHVSPVFYDPAQPEIPHVGLRATFVERAMIGRLRNTRIFLMGCDGMRSRTIANAFVQRGARAVFGWDKPVTAEHTDRAMLMLLAHELTQGSSITSAVSETNRLAGPDPVYGALLQYYSGS